MNITMEFSIFNLVQALNIILTLFRRRCKKPPHGNSLSVLPPQRLQTRNQPPKLQNFLSFSFNPLAALVQNVKAILSVSPKLLNLDQEHLQKSCFFRSNPYKIEVMITSLIVILELSNISHITTSKFGHMTTSIIIVM